MNEKQAHQLIEEMELRRNGLFAQLRKMDIDVLNKRPKEGKWSILEIVAHLVISEEMSVSYSLYKLKKNKPLPSVNFINAIKSAILNKVLLWNIPYKAPSAVHPDPNSPYSIDELEERWSKARADLGSIAEFPLEQLKRGVLKHPYAGYLNYKQMLQFMSAHYAHHLTQINRIVRSN